MLFEKRAEIRLALAHTHTTANPNACIVPVVRWNVNQFAHPIGGPNHFALHCMDAAVRAYVSVVCLCANDDEDQTGPMNGCSA